MGGIITTVGVLYFKDEQGNRTGCVDICHSDDGEIHMRVNGQGEEVVLRFKADSARSVAKLLNRAAGG